MRNGYNTEFNSRSVMTNVDLLEPMCEDVSVDNDESEDDLAATQEELDTKMWNDNDNNMQEDFVDLLIDDDHANGSLGGHVAQNCNAECIGTSSPEVVHHVFEDSNEDDNDYTTIHPPNIIELKVQMLSMWT